MNMSDGADNAALLRCGSRSFHAASRLLPGEIRRAATALYAFCRVADDAIDTVAAEERPAALAELRARLAAIYAGTPHPYPADRAFAGVVARYNIPRAWPEALLEGFAWDAEGRRYATIAALHDYAARVAAVVGAMMALVMGVRDPVVLARACELGLAMQLTNIARDVGEDARAGRLYLPLDWLAEAGIDPDAFLAAPECDDRLRGVVARLLAEAEALYASGAAGIAHLPRMCRPAIAAAHRLYQAIGHAAGAPGFDPVQARAVVPGKRKAVLVGHALAASLAPARVLSAAAPPCVLALVGEAELAPVRTALPVWRRAEDRAVWVLDLFAALEARNAR